MRSPWAVVLGLILSASVWAGPARGGEKTLPLCDFEADADLKQWDFTAGKASLSDEGVTSGKRAMAIQFDPKGQYHPAYIYWNRPRRDWSAYDAIALDVFNPSDEPMPGYVLIADQAWADKGRTYWNRHNGSTTFPPGLTRWVISVGGLYRGEAGSRNNDIKRNIDADKIVRVDFGFGAKGKTGRVIIDNLRLIRADRPAGVWAFDFGPPDQSVMLGWTGVSNQTAYAKARGFGWGPQGGTPWNGAARDNTFATALLRDFCEAGGYRFHVDVPAGKYRVTVIYENCGYWGGEQAQQKSRSIRVGDTEVWREDRPDGSAHALWRFENTEPRPGMDLWDTYLTGELAKPAAFDAVAGSDGLTLQFQADRPWGSKLCALVVHRADDKPAAEWLGGQLKELADEFRSKAVCLDPPLPEFQPTGAWAGSKLQAWPVGVEDDVVPHLLPPDDAPAPDKLALTARVARGECEALCLAMLPATDANLPKALAEFRWTDGPAELPAELLVTWYNTSRGFNSIAWHLRPHTLRDASDLRLGSPGCRELILRLRVPADAKPGEYRGTLNILPEPGGKTLGVPVTVTVSPVVLRRDTAFRMGFFGLEPPGLLPPERREAVLEQTLDLLAESGMNLVSGGPSWKLIGWRDGRPQIDFGQTDRFFAMLHKHGFDGPVNGYGGLRFVGLHDGYQKGPTAAVEKASGLPYEQALLAAWKAVDQHARENHWPAIWYAMCDETRVRDVAERELEFMKLMAKVSEAFPQTLRTSGSYSVSFRSRAKDVDDLLYWHQRFFEALDISSLNGHDPTVLAEAKRLGKSVQIYNQGTSRYSFGLYQWCEHRHGVAARVQWHLNVLHGYQFFDLDGREPDTAMLCYGREKLYRTIGLERCREGAEDFYLYHTLAQAVADAKPGPARDAAAKLLTRLDSAVDLNQRSAPEGYAPRKLRNEALDAIEAIQSER